MDRLVEWSRAARRLVADERLTEEEREQRFVADALLDLRRIVGVADAEQYSRAGSIRIRGKVWRVTGGNASG